MAVNEREMNGEDVFTKIGMLIIQGRKWDSFRGCRTRTPHCPSIRQGSPQQHQCSSSNVECQRATSYQNAIQSIWRRNSPMAIDVVMLPECGHQFPFLLLERWCLQFEDGKPSMPIFSLMQAIDSTIHFSQLSSWWASTNGCQPEKIQFRVHGEEPSANLPSFIEPPTTHQFPTSHNITVTVQYLPRQQKIPEPICANCSHSIPQPMDTSVGSPMRGRSFLVRGRRRGSRHSSASSDSLSPSVRRLDVSPFGSPLMTSRLSSSSSRGSSRTASPCVNRTTSEQNMVLTFETSLELNENVGDFHSEPRNIETNQDDSGFVEQTLRENSVIDQDEELANQLDSLSDSDLSDDYVIDGPVGSPGLVHSSVALPDDARVQRLQSTFAGWHCRRPTFDRLMSETGPNRTRHSSLDSAVSNLERLDLRTQRRLSRTSSDGQDFSNVTPMENTVKEKDFFITDMKKRHKMQSLDFLEGKTTPSPKYSNDFQAAFCTSLKNPPNCEDNFRHKATANKNMKLTFADESADSDVGNHFLPFHPLSHFDSTPLSLPFSLSGTENSNERCGNCSSHDCDMCESPTSILAPKFFTKGEHAPKIASSSTPHAKGLWDIAYPNTMNGITESDFQNGSLKDVFSIKNLESNQVTLDCGHFVGNSEKDRQDLKAHTQEVPKAGDIDAMATALLKSPPSKLRILPNNCLDKSYLHNPPRDAAHKITAMTPFKHARCLNFTQSNGPRPGSSPAPIRRKNSVRFEFDEDMPKLNQRSSRSACKGQCMKKNGTVMHGRCKTAPTRRLLGSFEESIIHGCFEVLGSVDGFTAQLGASGSFCPAKVKLPVPVSFFHVSEDNAPSPYLGTMSLKSRECGKRGYHIPSKGTIQLTLFNPNKSVVKVFVILYDVSDMPPGHRTFLRHRIFSKATCGNSRLDQNNNLPSEKAPSAMKSNENSTYLRYCVNLWLESSKTNRVYIHGDTKILFSLASNEWDSGNTYELHAETGFPSNPRYSPKR